MSDTRQRTLELAQAIAEGFNVVPQSLSSDTQTRSLQLLENIARHLGQLEPLPPAPMPTKLFTIGTSSRDYSTLSAHEADLDSGVLYASGDDAIGEVYNDSVFDENVTYDGGGTIGLNSVTIQPATGEGHDGTAGSGVRLVSSSDQSSNITISSNITRVIGIEIDANGFRGDYLITHTAFGSNERCLLHGSTAASGPQDQYGVSHTTGTDPTIVNNIIYDISNGNTFREAKGIRCTGGGISDPKVHNNTVYNIASSGSNRGIGIQLNDAGAKEGRNNLVANVTGTGNVCFSPASPSTITMDHNASDDSTHSGTGSIAIVAGDEFVSTLAGSEDLHLKSGADSIGAGVDLGTTPTGVEIDIDGRDRDAEGDTWDIGADQFVASGGGGIEGSTNETLAALSSTATGEVQIAGESAATLGSMLGSGTGGIAIEGLTSGTLGEATSAADATLTLSGESSATLGSLNVDATGSAGNSIAGIVDVSLGGLTTVAESELTVVGETSGTLGILTGSATSGLAIEGLTSGALGALGSTGEATLKNEGQAAAQLGELTLSATNEVNDGTLVPLYYYTIIAGN